MRSGPVWTPKSAPFRASFSTDSASRPDPRAGLRTLSPRPDGLGFGDGPSYEELLCDPTGQATPNVDETGRGHAGRQHRAWCFLGAGRYTLFKIDPTRGGDVLIEVLGEEFAGVLGCEDFSAYGRDHREFDVMLQAGQDRPR